MAKPISKFPKIKTSKFVVLVGLMGAGKTSMGQRLAFAIDLPFFDTDAEIEKAADNTIEEIFKNFGEKQFREGERRVIKRLLNGEPAVIASGGGSFMDVKTRKLIREKAISIWLRADLELLYRRTARRRHRPLLNNANPKKTLMRLMKERHSTYEEADIIFDVTDEAPEKTAKRLLETLIGYRTKNQKDSNSI